MELARRVAELQFLNREHVLIFRGQKADYVNNKDSTTLKPSLFREINGQNPDSVKLQYRFDALKVAENYLAEIYQRERYLGRDRLSRQRMLRWSIIQHYEICPTPLLDVTHSLRIAASFASIDAGSEAFVYVLGVPNLSGAITASAEAGLQIIRLSSVCPPAALRPHIQEGYLLGEYPEMAEFEQKKHYGHFEIDFGRRLVAKFKFDPRTFWRNADFPQVEYAALYADKNDPLFNIIQPIKNLTRS